MRIARLALASIAVVACFTVVAEAPSVENWAAPPWWVPPAAAPAEESGRMALTEGRQQLVTTPLPLPFVPVAPCRLVDTRGGAPLTGGFLPASTVRSYTLAGVCN